MSMSAPSKPSFRVLPGGRQASDSIAGCRIVVSPEHDPPFEVDAVVYEEDTWMSLSAKTGVVSAPSHPLRVMTRVWEARAVPPGTVIAKAGHPVRLMAVVHDLDAEPTWKEAWVATALSRVLTHAVDHELRSIKLPLLGSRHGGLSAPRFMRLLRQQLETAVDAAQEEELSLRRIWLVQETESGVELLRALTDGS